MTSNQTMKVLLDIECCTEYNCVSMNHLSTRFTGLYQLKVIVLKLTETKLRSDIPRLSLKISFYKKIKTQLYKL